MGNVPQDRGLLQGLKFLLLCRSPRLIAAIMAAPDFKARFGDAQTLLNYGYANCKLYEDKEHLPLPQMPVTGGVEDEVALTYEGTFSYLSLKGEDLGAIEKNLVLEESIPAPVEPAAHSVNPNLYVFFSPSSVPSAVLSVCDPDWSALVSFSLVRAAVVSAFTSSCFAVVASAFAPFPHPVNAIVTRLTPITMFLKYFVIIPLLFIHCMN